MPYLYTKTAPTALPSGFTTKGDIGSLARQLVASLPGVPIDVVQDFSWTLTPTTSIARKNAPVIYLNEFYQLESQLNQSLRPYGKGGLDTTNFTFDTVLKALDSFAVITGKEALDNKNLYKGLFDHLSPTGFNYKLPYFTDEYFGFSNSWEKNDILDTILSLQEQIGGFASNAVTGVVKALGKEIKSTGVQDFINQVPRKMKQIETFNLASQNPTVGLMDPPSVWKNSSRNQNTFEFPLYNILLPGTFNNTETIIKNWELCYILTYQNLVNKKNFYTGIPPVFYEVLIPGVFYSKASYISELNISNIGNIRRLSLPIDGSTATDVNVPDAYLISITLTDLLTPSKNLLDASVRTKVTSSIASTTSIAATQ